MSYSVTVDPSPNKGSKAKAISLQMQLLRTVLPIILVPLIIASGIGYRVIQKRSEDRVQRQLTDQALLTSEGTRAVLDDLLDLPRSIASNPLVINEALAGGQEAIQKGLDRLSTEELESQFSQTKLLRKHTTLNAHLQEVVKTAEISEILITEQHGLNVAYSDSATDFVQSDEQWWQVGKTEGQWISPPDFNFAAKSFTVELVQAIHDPKTQNFLGVVRATLPARKFSLLSNYVQRTGISGSQRVQLIDATTQRVIDTFSPQGFRSEPNIIGGEAIEQVIAALASNPVPSQATPQEISAHASRLAQTLRALPSIKQVSVVPSDDGTLLISFVQAKRQYKVATIPTTDWLAISSMTRGEILAAGRAFLGLFALCALALGGATSALLVVVANQLATPLKKLSLNAAEVAGGNLSVTATPEGTMETLLLANTFNQLVASTRDLLKLQTDETEKASLWAKITGTRATELQTFKAVLEEVLPDVRHLLNAERVFLIRVLPNGDSYVEAVTSDTTLENQDWNAEYLFPQLAEEHPSSQAVVLNQIELESLPPEAYQYCCDQLGVKASLAVPVYTETRLFSWFVAHRCVADHPWQSSDITFLEQLAAQTTLVLDRILSLQQLQESRQITESLSEKLRLQKQELQQQIAQLLNQQETRPGMVETTSSELVTVDQSDGVVKRHQQALMADLTQMADFCKRTFNHLKQLAAQIEHTNVQVNTTLVNSEQSAMEAAEAFRQRATPMTEKLSALQRAIQATVRLIDMLHQSVQRQRSLAGIALNLGTATNLHSGNHTQESQRSLENMVKSFQQETEHILESLAQIRSEMSDSSGLLQDSQEQMVNLLTGAEQLDQLAQVLSQATIDQLQSNQAIANLVQAVDQSSDQTSLFKSSESETNGHTSETNGHTAETNGHTEMKFDAYVTS